MPSALPSAPAWPLSPLSPLAESSDYGEDTLITAIERFDPAKSRKLSTYDTWWIHQAIGRVIAEEGRVIGP